MNIANETIGRLAQGVIPEGAMATPAPQLTISVRQFHKSGLLRDKPAFFALKWTTGDELLVTAEREEVNLYYLRGDEEASEKIPVTWSDDKPWLTCACGKRVTKQFFDGERFRCHWCYARVVFPPRPKRRAKRIPVDTRLRALARDGFQCVGCGTTEGTLRLKRAYECDECVRLTPAFDRNLYTVCQTCSDGLRRGFGGVIGLTRELHRRGNLNLLQHRNGSLPLTSISEDATSSRIQIEEMKHQPRSDTNLMTESAILAPETAISVHERRKIQRKQRIQRAQRVLLKLLAGVGPSRIAEEEHISRSTVWRYRWRVHHLVPIVRRMMRDAVRKQDWQEARFWSACLANVGAEIDGDHKPRGADAREWRKRLEAFRDDHLTPQTAAATSEKEARPEPSAVIRAVESLTERGVEEREPFEALRRAAWRAQIAYRDDPTKVGRRNFLSALYSPIQLANVKVALSQWAKGQRE